METKVNINHDGNEVIIREGKAVEVFPERRIVIKGTLKAPADFLEHKTAKYHGLECHLKVHNSSGIICLELNEKDEKGDSITGELSLNPIAAEFGINTDKKWSINDFRQFIQKKSFFFATKEDYNKTLVSIQKFKSEVIKIYHNENTNDGNSKLLLESKVQEANVLPVFNLSFPIYLGYGKKSFPVEVGLDVTSAETKIFLYSEGLYTLQEELKETYLKDELKRFGQPNFPIMSIVNID